MAINSLSVNNFRNLTIHQMELYPRGVHVISGANGSGKTSFLETIYYLSLCRSFRSSASAQLICHDADKFSIFAKITQQDCIIPIGMERNFAGDLNIHVAEQKLTQIFELTYRLPIRLFNSQFHQLIEAGPLFRRKYLDWGLFYHYENFLHYWSQFARALKQRNLLLRRKSSLPEIRPWTHELIKYGLLLHELRHAYVQQLIPLIQQMAALLSISSLHFNYYPGWSAQIDYAEALFDQCEEELRFGYTLCGPHRADFEVFFHDQPAKHVLSRGQQKLLICAMILAQGLLFNQQLNKGLIYLVDDLPAELDESNRYKLLSLLFEQNAQVFITTVDRQDINEKLQHLSKPTKVFHVEQGKFAECF